jgi:hypothetical protein
LLCFLQAGNVAAAEEASQSAVGAGAVLPTLSLLRVVDLVDALWEHMPQVIVFSCLVVVGSAGICSNSSSSSTCFKQQLSLLRVVDLVDALWEQMPQVRVFFSGWLLLALLVSAATAAAHASNLI